MNRPPGRRHQFPPCKAPNSSGRLSAHHPAIEQAHRPNDYQWTVPATVSQSVAVLRSAERRKTGYDRLQHKIAIQTHFVARIPAGACRRGKNSDNLDFVRLPLFLGQTRLRVREREQLRHRHLTHQHRLSICRRATKMPLILRRKPR